MRRREDFDPSVPVYDEDGTQIYEWDDSKGILIGNYTQEGEELTLLSYTYRQLSDEEIAEIDEEEREALKSTQLKTAAAMYIRSSASTLTDSQAASVSLLFDDWSVDVDYKQGDTRRYDDKLWRCSQAHKAQVGWEPGVAPSLWYEIMIAPDGILVWKEPGGAHNAYNYGDKVHYPDADGAIYVSKRDGNISVPGTDEWWVPEDAE